jgi:hypothetical protein
MGLRADVVRSDVLALPTLRGGPVPVRGSAHRAAIGLVAVVVVILLSPFLFDLATPALAR